MNIYEYINDVSSTLVLSQRCIQPGAMVYIKNLLLFLLLSLLSICLYVDGNIKGGSSYSCQSYK